MLIQTGHGSRTGAYVFPSDTAPAIAGLPSRQLQAASVMRCVGCSTKGGAQVGHQHLPGRDVWRPIVYLCMMLCFPVLCPGVKRLCLHAQIRMAPGAAHDSMFLVLTAYLCTCQWPAAPAHVLYTHGNSWCTLVQQHYSTGEGFRRGVTMELLHGAF